MNVAALQALTAFVQSGAPAKVNLNVVGGVGQPLPNWNVARTCTSDVVYPTAGFTKSFVVGVMRVKASLVAGPKAAAAATSSRATRQLRITRPQNFAGIGANCALDPWTFIVAPLHSAQQKMRGRGWAVAFLAATGIFAGACDLGGRTTNPTARISPESSPSSATGNPTTSSPPASSPR